VVAEADDRNPNDLFLSPLMSYTQNKVSPPSPPPSAPPPFLLLSLKAPNPL
jgi:hypothetical protein